VNDEAFMKLDGRLDSALRAEPFIAASSSVPTVDGATTMAKILGQQWRQPMNRTLRITLGAGAATAVLAAGAGLAMTVGDHEVSGPAADHARAAALQAVPGGSAGDVEHQYEQDGWPVYVVSVTAPGHRAVTVRLDMGFRWLGTQPAYGHDGRYADGVWH